MTINNIYDETYERMWTNTLKTRESLEEATRKVIVKTTVIDFYPVGAHKDKAVEDCEVAKRFFLLMLNRYDSKLQETTEYFLKHRNELKKCREWNPERMPTSHEIVELTYEKTIRR